MDKSLEEKVGECQAFNEIRTGGLYVLLSGSHGIPISQSGTGTKMILDKKGSRTDTAIIREEYEKLLITLYSEHPDGGYGVRLPLNGPNVKANSEKGEK